MSINDLIPYRESLEKAAAILGWTKAESKREHERDYECSWTETVWLSSKGEYMFDESDLQPGLLHEILRLAGKIGG